jgi:histidine kinase
VLVALLVSLFLSRRIVAPVRTLTDASQHIAEGHYDQRVQVNGSDEIAQLATRFNQMATQLEQVESMRRQLIGDVTHELRTPLTSIKGYMEGLVDGVLPSTPETFNQIHHEADRLSRLVDDLRIEPRSKGIFHVRTVAVSNRTIVARHPSESQTYRPRSDLPADLPSIRLTDRTRCSRPRGERIQYTPEGGEATGFAARHMDCDSCFRAILALVSYRSHPPFTLDVDVPLM